MCGYVQTHGCSVHIFHVVSVFFCLFIICIYKLPISRMKPMSDIIWLYLVMPHI
jgi:hypothetical protein